MFHKNVKRKSQKCQKILSEIKILTLDACGIIVLLDIVFRRRYSPSAKHPNFPIIFQVRAAKRPFHDIVYPVRAAERPNFPIIFQVGAAKHPVEIGRYYEK